MSALDHAYIACSRDATVRWMSATDGRNQLTWQFWVVCRQSHKQPVGYVTSSDSDASGDRDVNDTPKAVCASTDRLS